MLSSAGLVVRSCMWRGWYLAAHSLQLSLAKSTWEKLNSLAAQDTRRLEVLLHRARGKVGLDKTRKMLKKAIKVSFFLGRFAANAP